MEKLIEIKHLTTAFIDEKKRLTTILNNVSLDINKGEILGIVGESGSGKSVMGKTIMRLIPDPPGKILSGEILFDDGNILDKTEAEMLKIRGNVISMIFQEPMTSLNPVYTCGEQIIEAIIRHKKLSRNAAKDMAIEMMRQVGIPLPETRINNYPHEMSGGMRQRVIIAMALSCEPQLLIADEPTTALDSTVQAQILELIENIQKNNNMTIFYITHDLGVVAEICDRVIVLYGGRIMEEAMVGELFSSPLHPYTKGLMKAIPRIDQNVDRLYNIQGNVPSFQEMPKGCPFCTRCSDTMNECIDACPELIEISPGHKVSCWLHKN